MQLQKEIQLNQTYRIAAFQDKEAALCLYAMGIKPGHQLKILRKSPFGQSYFVAIGNRRLAMRLRELSSMLLEPLNGGAI